METAKKGKAKKSNPKKGKSLVKLINKSDSDTDDSEHELSHYLDDRVKLMKEVLKIIKPKKMKSMAPKWMRNLEMEEINSMLFEELLGISNKRLKCIFDGKKLEDDNSSSTDPDEEQQKVDIISLDDISDDEFVINLDSDENFISKHEKTDTIKVKEECKRKKIKKEKRDKISKKSKPPDKDKKDDEQNLMSVLELLELQARARAIKSQLALESKKKAEQKEHTQISEAKEEKSDNEDAVVIESPKNIEIIITSSESENEEPKDSTSKSGDMNRNNEQVQTEQCNSKENITRSVSLSEETSQQDDVNKIGKRSKSSANENLSSPKVTIITDITIEASSKVSNEGENKVRKRELSNESDSKSEHEESEANSETKNADSEFRKNTGEDSKRETSKTKDKVGKKPRIYRKKKLSEDESNRENDKSDDGNSKVEETTADSSSKKTDSGDPGLGTSGSCEKPDQIKAELININSQNSNRIEESDGIVINVDQSEIECIISD